MKGWITSLVPCLLMASSGQAALSWISNSSTPMVLTSGIITYDSVGATAFANAYLDVNANGVFGESGEPTGNLATSMDFTLSPIIGTSSFIFGLDGFSTVDAGGFASASFTVTRTDASTETVTVSTTTPFDLTDSTGDEWQISLAFNRDHYGDVVSNADTGPGLSATDHQAIFTFTLVPEPSRTTLLMLGSLSFVLRRRR